MARPARKGSSMCDLYPAIRQMVRGIKDAEKKNFKDGVHRLRGREDDEAIQIRSECYDLRERRLFDLRKLLNWALPAGIKAGFSGEHVVARLNRLMNRVEKAAYWNERCRGPVDDDAEALFHFEELFDKVEDDLEQLYCARPKMRFFWTAALILL